MSHLSWSVWTGGIITVSGIRDTVEVHVEIEQADKVFKLRRFPRESNIPNLANDYFFPFTFAGVAFFPVLPESTFPPSTLTLLGQTHGMMSSSACYLEVLSLLPFKLASNSFSRRPISSASSPSSCTGILRNPARIPRAAFPFFVAPGVSFALYLYRVNADQGAHTAIASEMMSPGFGQATKSLNERSSS
jgi:hypothetical protein